MEPEILTVFIGLGGGLVALVLNVRALTGATRLPNLWGGWAFVVGASVAGLAAWRATFFVEIRRLTIEGVIRHFGWPFPMLTDSMWGEPVGGPVFTIGNIVFWLLAPQIVVSLYWLHLRTK